MFIKPSKFEKLIKTAYKDNRLHVGNDGENFLAAGAGWSMAMKEHLIPKELKAIIIKYVGYMPDPQECFLALEEGDQAEVPGAFIGKENVKDMPFAEATRLAYIRNGVVFNIFQSVSKTKDFMIQASLIDLIDESEIDDQDGELRIRGPFLDLAGNQIIVENDRMQLRLFISSPDPAGAELLEHLEKTDLNSFGEEET